MNPLILNFFISNLAMQTETQARIKMPDHEWGKLVSLSYIVQPDKNVMQVLTWENHIGKKILAKDEAQKLASSLSIDIDAEMDGRNEEKKPCKSIFCSANINPQKVVIQYNFLDGSPSKLINL